MKRKDEIMDVRKILQHYLNNNVGKYDGLINNELHCSCLTQGICKHVSIKCEAGYKKLYPNENFKEWFIIKGER